MKKISILLLGLFCCVQAFSQSSAGCSDTSYVRYKQFDIWDWWMADSNNRLVTEHPLVFPYSSSVPYEQDILQYNYTADPNGVKVLGLSVWDISRARGGRTNNAQEYLYLYDAQPDEFRLMAQVPWSPTDTAYLYDFLHTGYLPNVCQAKHTAHPFLDSMYDYYFDTPIIVHDSFYVGCSVNSFNNLYGVFRSGFHRLTDCNIPPILWKIYNHSSTAYTFFYPTDEWTYANSDNFLMVLPIIEVIDTGIVLPCEAPSDVRLTGNWTDSITVTWSADSRYEKYVVHYCYGEFEPTNPGFADTVYTNQWAYTGPGHTDELMTAYVTGVCNDCDSVREGEKSRNLYFRWRQREQTGVEEADEAGGLVRLVPNPAKEMVRVESAYEIGRVEVYDAKGRQVLEQQVGGNVADIRVSAWEPGVYVVRLHTAGGMASKRLLVE